MDVPLHPSCEAISFLLGTWEGEGKGIYPTIADFEYREESRFWHTGKPFLVYQQRTWSIEDGSPLHTEMGFWRCQEEGVLELILAHAFGIAEVEEGRVHGNRVEVRSTKMAPSSTAETVLGVSRVFEVDGDVMTYELSMAAADLPLQNHLTAELRRVSQSSSAAY